MTILVSVLMPAKNAGEFIRESIASILEQTYQNIELLIINDNSTDNTLDVINHFNDERIKVLTGNGTGISDAFNLGLAEAKGKYFCRCDSDDLYPRDRIITQLNWLENNSDFIAVCGKYSSIDSKGRHLVEYLRDESSQNIQDSFRRGETITHFCTFMTKTSALKKLGGCRPFFVTGEDIDLQLRLSELGPIYFLAINFYFYRLHHLSITHTQSNSHREFYETVARHSHHLRLKGHIDDIDSGVKLEIPEKNDTPRNVNFKIRNQLISESWYLHKNSKKITAIKAAGKVIRIYPMSLKVWWNFFLIIVKK